MRSLRRYRRNPAIFFDKVFNTRILPTGELEIVAKCSNSSEPQRLIVYNNDGFQWRVDKDPRFDSRDPSHPDFVRRRRGYRRNPDDFDLDPSLLTEFRRNPDDFDLDPSLLTEFRRKKHNRHRRYRRNPDPDGKPWGPKLYNPLQDTNSKFKDDRHYKNIISKLRRNPW
jgi:hypothetical protein